MSLVSVDTDFWFGGVHAWWALFGGAYARWALFGGVYAQWTLGFYWECDVFYILAPTAYLL